MASVACEVELGCRGDVAAARLVSPSGLAWFPGLVPEPADPPALAEHDFEFPYLGARRQTTALQIERSDGAGEVIVRGSGPLISYAARWALGNCARGSVTLEYELAEPLMIEAMNEMRSRSPLPFRSDADAILRLAVTEAFEAYFARVLGEYAEAARARLEVKA